jgi:hypothetical protein
MVMVTVNYEYEGDPVEWAKAYTPERAEMFVNLPGLLWKIWLDAPEDLRTGGIYHFEDRASADAYTNGPLMDRHRNNSLLQNLQVRTFNTRAEMNRITRAPVLNADSSLSKNAAE